MGAALLLASSSTKVRGVFTVQPSRLSALVTGAWLLLCLRQFSKGIHHHAIMGTPGPLVATSCAIEQGTFTPGIVKSPTREPTNPDSRILDGEAAPFQGPTFGETVAPTFYRHGVPKFAKRKLMAAPASPERLFRWLPCGPLASAAESYREMCRALCPWHQTLAQPFAGCSIAFAILASYLGPFAPSPKGNLSYLPFGRAVWAS